MATVKKRRTRRSQREYVLLAPYVSRVTGARSHLLLEISALDGSSHSSAVECAAELLVLQGGLIEAINSSTGVEIPGGARAEDLEFASCWLFEKPRSEQRRTRRAT